MVMVIKLSRNLNFSKIVLSSSDTKKMVKNKYRKITSSALLENVSFFSTLFFQWMNNLMKTGSERAVDENDLLPLQEENTTRFLTEKLQAKWIEETADSKRHDLTPKLWKSVFKMLTRKNSLILITAGSFITFCRILQPLLLGYLIKSLMIADLQHNYLLYGCASAIGINELVCSLSSHQFDYHCELLGIRISCALKGLVYMKVKVINYNYDRRRTEHDNREKFFPRFRQDIPSSS